MQQTHLKPKKLCSESERRSLLNSMSFCSFFIPTNRFAGIARSKFWLKCISCKFVRLLNACEWISFILFAAKSRIWRFRRYLKCCASIFVRKLFFNDKYCRCNRLSRAFWLKCTGTSLTFFSYYSTEFSSRSFNQLFSFDLTCQLELFQSLNWILLAWLIWNLDWFIRH